MLIPLDMICTKCLHKTILLVKWQIYRKRNIISSRLQKRNLAWNLYWIDIPMRVCNTPHSIKYLNNQPHAKAYSHSHYIIIGRWIIRYRRYTRKHTFRNVNISTPRAPHRNWNDDGWKCSSFDIEKYYKWKGCVRWLVCV